MNWRGSRVWLVGASTGIGAALARELDRRGALLTLSARSGDALDRLNSTLSAKAHDVRVCDVLSRESVRTAMPDPFPHVIVCNAGTYTPMPVEAMDLAEIERMIDVNLLGTFRLIDAVLPVLKARRTGMLVLVGSVAGYYGLPQSLGYGASKAAINHLAESLALELAPLGIDVRLVCPGFVRTRLTEKNAFLMPFLMEPEDAARRIADGLEGPAFEIHFPRRLTWGMKLIGLLPPRIRMTAVRAITGAKARRHS